MMNAATQALRLEEMEQVVGGVEDPIVSITVKWQNGNGHQYGYTVSNPKYDPRFDIIQTVTWEDGSGNRYSTTVKD